ncbi:hypothetical protein ACK34J_05425 [Aeromonas veronii]
MYNRLHMLLLVIFSAASSHALSMTAPRYFSWSGHVPLTPPLVITKTTQPTSPQAVVSFELSGIHTPLTYSLVLSSGTATIPPLITQHTMTAETLSDAEQFTEYAVTTTTQHHTRVFHFNTIKSEHSDKEIKPTIITVSSLI